MNAVQCGLVIALSLPVSACIYAGSDVRRSADESDSEELRQALRRVVLVGEVSDRNHALRMREAAALAVSKRQPSMSEVQQIIDIMVDELVRAGAANDLKQAYRVQDVYPVVQAACQISDEELLIALLKHLRPQKRGERQIADRIVQDANLWRTGVRFGRREFLVISTAIERGHLTDPRQDETGVLLSNTLWDQVPAYWTWRRYGQIPQARVEEFGTRLEYLEYVESRVTQLKDPDAADEARSLLRQLAAEDSWLIRAIVLAAMREDALYDPAAMALLEQRAEDFQRPTIEYVKGTRQARGLPLDKTTPPSESRTM